MGNIYVGVSGWTYAPWRGKFYPKKWVQKRELEYASRQLSSIEINGTFYSLQKPESFQNWYEQTPDSFLFSVKGGQYITHVRRLKDVDLALANFFASGILCLKEKLGPILWQFPHFVMLRDDRFERFLKLLPRDSKSAARLAKKHGSKMEGRAWTQAGGNFPIRHAFEFRHPSFWNEDFIRLMSKHNAAMVFAHEGKRGPYFEEITADFIYARLHGEGKKYAKGYSKKELKGWSKKAGIWCRGLEDSQGPKILKNKVAKTPRDVFIYFDNSVKVTAPLNALALQEELGLSSVSKAS